MIVASMDTHSNARQDAGVPPTNDPSSGEICLGPGRRLAVLTAAVGVLLAGCGGTPEPLGLADSAAQDEVVVAVEAPEASASASSQPTDEMGEADEPVQLGDSAESADRVSTEDPVESVDPMPSIDAAEQAPPELEVATSGASAMTEGAYLALPRYVQGFGMPDQAFTDCRAANRDLRGELRNDENPCEARSVSVDGLPMTVVRACGTTRTTYRYVCRDFARLYTVDNQGRWDGGDQSSRWVLSLDHASGATLAGRMDVTEIDPTSGVELRPVCGVGDASVRGGTLCAADTMRPQAPSRAWRISMSKGEVSSGFARRAVEGTAAVVRQSGSALTVSDVAPGLRARVDAGRVLIGAAPGQEWQELPGVAVRPSVEVVIDARQSDVDVAGMPRTTDGVAPAGCPEEFRVRAGERRVLCTIADEDQMGFFQLDFTRFVLSEGARSRDLPWALVRTDRQAEFRASSSAAATISTERAGASASRVIIVPRRAREVGLVAKDPYRVTATLVLDTSALGDANVRYVQAVVEDGRNVAQGCESVEIRYAESNVNRLCSFTMRPASITSGVGFDTKFVYLKSLISSWPPLFDAVQEISFALDFTVGVPRPYAVRVRDVRSRGGVVADPKVTWTGTDAFTVTIPARRP